MKISEKGIALIKSFEGLRLESYLCPGKKWTIGYGHTGKVNGMSLKKGIVITRQESYFLLKEDINKFEDAINKYVKVDISQNQFDALVSFAYNVGIANFRLSTLLRKLNKKYYIGASKEFSRWNKAKGKVLDGLIRRRESERVLFNTEQE